jgi:hypothetical protein
MTVMNSIPRQFDKQPSNLTNNRKLSTLWDGQFCNVLSKTFGQASKLSKQLHDKLEVQHLPFLQASRTPHSSKPLLSPQPQHACHNNYNTPEH